MSPLYADDLLELQVLLRAGRTPAAVFRRCRLIWELAAGCNLGEAAELARMHYIDYILTSFSHDESEQDERINISSLSPNASGCWSIASRPAYLEDSIMSDFRHDFSE